MAEINRLSAARVAGNLAPGLYGDGGGLWLRVAGGSKSWVFRFKRDGAERRMGLGPLHTLSLADARERARQCRLAVLDGRDPIDDRRSARARAKEEAARLITFQQCAEFYIKAQIPGWKNAKHAAQWTSTLKTYAYPRIGVIAVNAIDTALVLKVIEPIWYTIPETASRLRGRIERILDWATVKGHRNGENPARWRGHLQQMLPARGKLRRVKHHAAMPYAEVPEFIAELRGHVGTSPRALEFTILTATRTNEVIEARWPEFDLATKVWTIPAERMKATRPHRVPLSSRVLDLLADLPREGTDGYLFIGASAGAPLSNMAMLELLQGIHPALTVHGFRSSFRDWAAEQTNFAREVAEAALAHVVKDKTEAAYRRGDLFKKRAALMEAWAKYCTRPAIATDAQAPGKIVTIRRVS
jgi:integrase